MLNDEFVVRTMEESRLVSLVVYLFSIPPHLRAILEVTFLLLR